MTPPAPPRWLAFDIGGANLKAAHAGGQAVARPFELWKRPDDLAEALGEVAALVPPSEAWAITMTAELCDCFATKADGVRSILAATVKAAGDRTVRVYGTDGQFHAVDAILPTPRLAAASNWLALGSVVARSGWGDSGLLIDIGSTTTDLIPWRDGQVMIPLDERTDHGRLRSGALIYAGVRRTPLCTFGPTLPHRGEPTALMAELFATTADVYLTLGNLPADPFDRSTGDGAPLTPAAALDRLARMVGLDRDDFTADDAHALAEAADAVLLDRLAHAAARVTTEALGEPPPVVVVAGAGEFLARRLADRVVAPGGSVRSLAETWGPRSLRRRLRPRLAPAHRGQSLMSNPVVVKLGGSLLDWPPLPARLNQFLAAQRGISPVLVVGGGRFADVLRDLDRLHDLGETRSHALALRVLDTTAHLAAALLPGSVVITEVDEIPRIWDVGKLPILAPRGFLDRDDRLAPDPLPHAWTTTTDSIAARLARHLRADLILLKSVPLPPEAPDWPTLARLGLVDPEFPRAVAGLAKVSVVCLKDQD